MLEKSNLNDKRTVRFQTKLEKIVEKIQDRHDKLIEKGCTFEQINQNPGFGAHFTDHSDTCRSIGDFVQGKI